MSKEGEQQSARKLSSLLERSERPLGGGSREQRPALSKGACDVASWVMLTAGAKPESWSYRSH